MTMIRTVFLVSLLLGCAFARSASTGTSEEEAAKWLKQYQLDATVQINKDTVASWNYNTNITEETNQAALDASAELAAFNREKGMEAKQFDIESFTDESLKRQLKMIGNLGIAALAPEEVDKYYELTNEMQAIYSTAKICPPKRPWCNLEKKGWALEPDIEKFFVESHNYRQLARVWKQWRDVSGKEMVDLFMDYVDLGNKAAKANGFSDMGEMWIDSYQMDMTENFKDDMERIWEQLRPMYEQLHAYVRHKLINYYGFRYKMAEDEPIPAHLFGNMWSQSWAALYDIVKPFEGTSEVDITESLNEQGYTIKKVFETADNFYQSIGHRGMPQSFYEISMLEKPEDREVVCHASAWDFYQNSDVRIKMCTEINMEDFFTVHHEMGHCEYYLQYEDQPVSFKNGANPGFHEAVGDTMSLSVQTPQHLHTIGLLGEPDDTKEFNLNYLMSMALDKVAFLPFGYLIDLYRWEIFSGKTTRDTLNYDWWVLREKYQGLVPPVKREKGQFDAGAKYHVAADVPYIRYFAAFILQFDFYKSACTAAGQYPDKPLHQCDFFNSKEAGDIIAKGLQAGSAVPWPETLEVMTGHKNMDASALLEYFQPLTDYLTEYNKNNNVHVGWKSGVIKDWVE